MHVCRRVCTCTCVGMHVYVRACVHAAQQPPKEKHLGCTYDLEQVVSSAFLVSVSSSGKIKGVGLDGSF